MVVARTFEDKATRTIREFDIDPTDFMSVFIKLVDDDTRPNTHHIIVAFCDTLIGWIEYRYIPIDSTETLEMIGCGSGAKNTFSAEQQKFSNAGPIEYTEEFIVSMFFECKKNHIGE